ncbi:hypothetical protein N9893_02085 [bacterium]|nr:hypothetical protein [bacterium]
MKYDLYRGKTLLGVVVHDTDDFPSHKGVFRPSESFKTVAALFEREIYLLESGRMNEWQKVRDEIDKPGIVLKSSKGSAKKIVNPVIHIDDYEVWWS